MLVCRCVDASALLTRHPWIRSIGISQLQNQESSDHGRSVVSKSKAKAASEANEALEEEVQAQAAEASHQSFRACSI